MKYMLNIWNWVKANFPFILIIVIFGMYVWANATSIKTKVSKKEDEISCKTLCFPQQSEYITHGSSSSCWCYINQNTMNKAK
jgi:hypothetical protein